MLFRSLGNNDNLYAVDPTTGASTVAGTFSANINALAITANGSAAYGTHFSQSGTSVTILRLDAVTEDATSSFTGTGNGSVLFYVGGAINPVTGIYYYTAIASGGVATIFAFNTNTNTNIGKIGTTTLAVSAKQRLTPNGDMAFDSGRQILFFVSTGTVNSGITESEGPRCRRPPEAFARWSTLVIVARSIGGNGIAFSSNGNLYVQAASGNHPHGHEPARPERPSLAPPSPSHSVPAGSTSDGSRIRVRLPPPSAVQKIISRSGQRSTDEFQAHDRPVPAG